MSSKSLQAPQIIQIQGSTIDIRHPDVSSYQFTSLLANSTAGGTSLTVRDNNGIEDDDYIILGTIGQSKTEEVQINGAVTRGQSLTIANTTKFNHSIDTRVTKILERKIKIYGAATNGGAGTIITSVGASGIDIEFDKKFTSYTLQTTDTVYNFYYATFFDGTTESDASEYVAAAGLTNKNVAKIVESALNAVNSDIDGEMITERWLLTVVNDAQDEVINHTTTRLIPKDWSFEIEEDKTSLVVTENENEYSLDDLTNEPKYFNSQRGIFTLYFGNYLLHFKDLRYFDRLFQYKKRTNLAVIANAGDTSITIDDAGEFSDSGNVYLGSDVISYSAVNKTTNVLSGIPASGDGSITTTHQVDSPVWQNIVPGRPRFYTIWNNKIILNVPPAEKYVDYKIKLKYLKKMPRIDSFSDTIDTPYSYMLKDYIAAQIEYKKNNTAEGDRRMNMFSNNLEQLSIRDPLQIIEQTDVYNFELPVNYGRYPRIENEGGYYYY